MRDPDGDVRYGDWGDFCGGPTCVRCEEGFCQHCDRTYADKPCHGRDPDEPAADTIGRYNGQLEIMSAALDAADARWSKAAHQLAAVEKDKQAIWAQVRQQQQLALQANVRASGLELEAAQLRLALAQAQQGDVSA